MGVSILWMHTHPKYNEEISYSKLWPIFPFIWIPWKQTTRIWFRLPVLKGLLTRRIPPKNSWDVCTPKMPQVSTYETEHVLTLLLLALHRKMVEKNLSNHRTNNGVNIEALRSPDWIGSCKVFEKKIAKPTFYGIFIAWNAGCFFYGVYVQFPGYILGYPDCQSWSTPKLALQLVVAPTRQAVEENAVVLQHGGIKQPAVKKRWIGDGWVLVCITYRIYHYVYTYNITQLSLISLYSILVLFRFHSQQW